jgi:hypothetical protein
MGKFFVLIFVIEVAIKIFGLGLVQGHKAYLRSPWNILDFLIVLGALSEFCLELMQV